MKENYKRDNEKLLERYYCGKKVTKVLFVK